STRRLSFNINESIFKTHSDIAKDWSPDRNGRLTPKMFSKSSKYEVSWRCHKCGMESNKRIDSYSGCRKCKEAKQLENKNLELDFPEISNEWDKEKNRDKLPRDFKVASSKRAWWLCSTCGHNWTAKI